MILKCSAVLVLLCLYYSPEFQVDGKPVDAYDEIMATDDKLFIQMLELIDSIGNDDSDDESGSSRYQSDEYRNGYKSNSEKCLLPRRKGVCRALIPRWSYDPISKECKEFKFGGCDGNGNNFSTEKSCMEACKGMWKKIETENNCIGGCQLNTGGWGWDTTIWFTADSILRTTRFDQITKKKLLFFCLF